MIDFFYKTGCQTDLVSIGTVSVSRLTHQLLLRKLSFQCILHGYGRISCTGHTHCLIYIGSSRERIPDRAAQTRCCTTERFNFRRMIVCLIFKVDKPFFFHAVNLDRHDNTARIDLV